MSGLGLDTSVAVPLLVQTHAAHREVVEWWGGRDIALCGYALVETYSVLTRLPGDLRLAPEDAARLISERFSDPLLLGRRTSRQLPTVLGELNVAGGAVYDALVALTALEHGATLATRDNRARATYELIGTSVVLATAPNHEARAIVNVMSPTISSPQRGACVGTSIRPMPSAGTAGE